MLNPAANDSPATCQACKAGTYQDQEEQALCLPCTPGKYMDQTGQSSCSNCDKGQFIDGSATDLTHCIVCPTGQYQDQKGTTFCVSSFYCLSGQHFSFLLWTVNSFLVCILYSFSIILSSLGALQGNLQRKHLPFPVHIVHLVKLWIREDLQQSM